MTPQETSGCTQLNLGEQRKQDGIQQVAKNNDEWMKSAITMVRVVAVNNDAFTSDDLRLLQPEPKHPNAWGALLKTAADQGIIERIGFVKSKLPSTHARMVSLWKRKE